jgi:tetratricopeptide (TPR) repeat protein
MAIVYFEQNKEHEAALALKSAEKCNDNTSEIYLKIGKYFYEHDNLEWAERLLIRGLEYNPDNKGILFCISDMYEKSGMPDKALTHIEKILEYCPYEILALYRKGLLLSMKNRFGEAIGIFESVIDKDPYHLGALFSLSTIYEKAGNVTMAMETYNKILAIEPENPEALVKLGYLHLEKSDFLMAEGFFINTIKSDKYLIDASLALSKIDVSRNDIEGCVINCDRIMKCLGLPGNVTIDSISDLSNLYIKIGNTLLKQQKELLAEKSFKISILLSPEAFDDENYHEKLLIGVNR